MILESAFQHAYSTYIQFFLKTIVFLRISTYNYLITTHVNKIIREITARQLVQQV